MEGRKAGRERSELWQGQEQMWGGDWRGKSGKGLAPKVFTSISSCIPHPGLALGGQRQAVTKRDKGHPGLESWQSQPRAEARSVRPELGRHLLNSVPVRWARMRKERDWPIPGRGRQSSVFSISRCLLASGTGGLSNCL